MWLDRPSNTFAVSLLKNTKTLFDVTWKITHSKTIITLEMDLLNQQLFQWLEMSVEAMLQIS
jgi:hypothetical protein